MGVKIKDFGSSPTGGRIYCFICPGCGNAHPVDAPNRWTWNGSFDKPTFFPSLLCNEHDQKSRCHSFITDGNIKFLEDCWHPLKNQTVEIQDWDNEKFI